MHISLFVIYFFLLCFIITRCRFFNGILKPAYLILFFSIHVAAGCIHNWVAFHYYPGHGDIWFFFEEGLKLRKIFTNDPKSFFRFLDRSEFNITDTTKPILDFQYQFFQRINFLLNIFSFNNLYINTLLFSLPVFAGSVALFKFFISVYRYVLPAIAALVLPSVLFWTSVVYKDGLFYMATGFFLYGLISPPASMLKRILVLCGCIALMVLSRANAFIVLLPAVIFLFLAEKRSFSTRVALIITVLLVAVVIIVVDHTLPAGILTSISERQKDFQSLVGGSRIALPVLEPSLPSLLNVLPAAVLNGLFQPFPGAGGKSIYSAFSAELLSYWMVILIAIYLMARSRSVRLSNFDLGCLLFAVPGMIIIGIIVPFAGAIIRYRSIFLPFLVAPFLHVLCGDSGGKIRSLNNWLSSNIMQPGARE